MTKYEYFETIADNWSVHKNVLKDGTVDLYLTTPVLSLFKDVDVLLDNNDTLYENFKEIRSILPITYRGGFKFENVPFGAVMLCINMGKPLGKSSMQDLLEDITTKLIILHFDVELFKYLSKMHGPSAELYDYISVTTDLGTGEIRPIYEDDVIKDPYMLMYVNKDEDTKQGHVISSFEYFDDAHIISWTPVDEELVIKTEEDTMSKHYYSIRDNWSVQVNDHLNGTRDIYVTTPVLSLVADFEKLIKNKEELYKAFDRIRFVSVEAYSGNFRFENVPEGAPVVRINVKKSFHDNSAPIRSLENDFILEHAILYLDKNLRDMTTDDLYDYIYTDTNLASGEIRPMINDGVMKDLYKLSFVNKDEDDYEYDKQSFLTSFKAFDCITVYHWVPKYELGCVNDAAVEKKDATHPAHYDYKITPLDAAFEWYKDLPSDEAILAFNAVKYLARFHKKNGNEDLEKAKTYIDFLLDLRANK